MKITHAVSEIAELPALGTLAIPYTVHLKTHGSPPPPVCQPQCTTTVVDYEWYCATAGIWVPLAVTQTICVDVPLCRVNVNQSTVVRIDWIGDCGPEAGPTPPLCVTNATGGPVRLCDCGVVSARGIGLPSLSSLIQSFVNLGEDKAAELIDKLRFSRRCRPRSDDTPGRSPVSVVPGSVIEDALGTLCEGALVNCGRLITDLVNRLAIDLNAALEKTANGILHGAV